MLNQVIQLWTDFLNDPVQGLNACLAQEPSGSSVPTVVAILDETRDVQVARGLYPTERTTQYPAVGNYPFPLIAVNFAETISLDPIPAGANTKRDAKVPLVMRYINVTSVTNQNIIDAYVVAEAMGRCLKLFMYGINQSYRVRDNIGIFSMERYDIDRVNVSEGAAPTLILSTTVTFNVRDMAP